MLEKNVLYNKAYEFSLALISIYEKLDGKRSVIILLNQLIRCGTSIGANVAEANGAISKSDFSAKISIAYKECMETKYWLSLLKDSGNIDTTVFETLYTKAEELSKIMFAILKTTRLNK